MAINLFYIEASYIMIFLSFYIAMQNLKNILNFKSDLIPEIESCLM